MEIIQSALESATRSIHTLHPLTSLTDHLTFSSFSESSSCSTSYCPPTQPSPSKKHVSWTTHSRTAALKAHTGRDTSWSSQNCGSAKENHWIDLERGVAPDVNVGVHFECAWCRQMVHVGRYSCDKPATLCDLAGRMSPTDFIYWCVAYAWPRSSKNVGHLDFQR